MRIRYVNVYDLIFNGAEECEILSEKPSNGDPYLVLVEDISAMAWRGVNELRYKSEILADELRTRPNLGIELNGPSVGLFEDARIKIMRNIYRYGFV